MKKTFLLAALLGVTGAFAADSYLYWMINTADSDAGKYNYNTVRISADGGSSYLTIYDAGFGSPYEVGGAGGITKSQALDAADWGDGFYASLAGVDVASASFVVELYNDSTFLARNYTASSGEIAGFIYSGGISGTSPLVPWTAGSFDIPEPSSGLLLLVGCAVLGLRRRRQANVLA